MTDRLYEGAVVLSCLTTLLVSANPSAQAADFTCSISGEVRHLHLDIPGPQHLCEVSVTPEGGDRRAVWYADNGTQFCSDKIEELVGKYENEWGFSCASWPRDDQLEELSRSERQRLDEILLDRRARNDGGPSSMRVVTGATQADGQRLLAVQWFGNTPAEDALSVFFGDDDTWTTLAYIEPLVQAIDAEEAAVQRAIIDSINEDGAVVLSTVVAAADDASTEPPACRGEQLFSINGEGALAALTPHRYGCRDALSTNAITD